MSNIRGKEDEQSDNIQEKSNKGIGREDWDVDKGKAIFTQNRAVNGRGNAKTSWGKIIKARNGISSVFEYAPNDLIGKDITIIMPPFIGNHHDQYLNRSLEKGKSSIIGVPTEMYAINKTKYIFPIHMYIKEYYSLQWGTIFLAMIKAVLKYN